jgi:hypothetical protein
MARINLIMPALTYTTHKFDIGNGTSSLFHLIQWVLSKKMHIVITLIRNVIGNRLVNFPKLSSLVGWKRKLNVCYIGSLDHLDHM